MYTFKGKLFWILYGIFDSDNTWMHAILFITHNIASLPLPVLHVTPSFFCVLIILLKKYYMFPQVTLFSKSVNHHSLKV